MGIKFNNQKAHQEYQSMLDEVFRVTERLKAIKDKHKVDESDQLKTVMLLEMIEHGGVLLLALNDLVNNEKSLVEPKKMMADAQRFVDLMDRHLK